MKMKISKREKILIGILSLILLTGGYYKFVFLHQRELLNKLLEEKTQCSEKIKSIENHSTLIKQREFDIKVLNSKILDKTSLLFPKLEEEKIIVELDTLLNKSNIKAHSLSFTGIEVKGIEVKEEQKKDTKNPLQDLVDEYNGVKVSNSKEKSNSANDTKNNDESQAENMAVSINFRGSYEEVLKFMKSLEGYGRKIVLDNLKLSQDTAMGVSGSTTLQFYAVPKLGDEDKNFLKWNFKNSYGKDNPFDGAAVSLVNTGTIEEIGKDKEIKFDFLMSARPISSDLPTIMIGKANDSSKSTYVYADNSAVENVEIYFTKKDDAYYYKYRTSKTHYPLNYDEEVEFTPNDKAINLKIFSNKRLNNNDLSGANIKIYNKTDKEVNLLVQDDDNVKPRVVISSEGGNVNVKRN